VPRLRFPARLVVAYQQQEIGLSRRGGQGPVDARGGYNGLESLRTSRLFECADGRDQVRAPHNEPKGFLFFLGTKAAGDA
jgi:hypothetical protein